MKNLSIVMKHLSIALLHLSLVLLLVSMSDGSAWGQVGLAKSTIPGLPPVKNYRPSDYHGGSGIWDIAQDKRGMLYLASDEGLITYDGNYWKRFPLPNKAAIKSLALDSSGRIYAGGQDQVGYFYPDAHGMLTYHTLSASLPEVARQFADIWDIILTPDGVMFRTVESLFLYGHDGTMRTFDAPAGWMMIASVGSRVFAVDKEKGLMEWKKQGWANPCPNQASAALHITGVTAYHMWAGVPADTVLVATLSSGLYLLTTAGLTPFHSDMDKLGDKGQVRCIRTLSSGYIAVGTQAQGLCLLGHQGWQIQQWSDQQGLQNNHIQKIFEDHAKGLWLGLESGLAYINTNSAVSKIAPLGLKEIACNSVCMYKNKLFIGTSNGVYCEGPQKFSLVPGTLGQVWGFSELGGDLFIGHESGAMLMEDQHAVPIPFATPQGVFTYVEGPQPGTLYAGTYTGIRKLVVAAGAHGGGASYKDAGRASDLYESLNQLVIDGQYLWAAHPYRGVFKTSIGADATHGDGAGAEPNSYINNDSLPHSVHYGPPLGLPSGTHYFLANIWNRIMVATENGIYAYDKTKDHFYIDLTLKKIFGNCTVENLTEAPGGDIWFVSNRRLGVIHWANPKDTGAYNQLYFPELDGQTIPGDPFIYPYSPDQIYVGAYNGVYHIDLSRYVKPDTGVSVVLSSVRLIGDNDSLIFGGFPLGNAGGSTGIAAGGAGAEQAHLPHRLNSFRFEYSSPEFSDGSGTTYSYKLEGLDQNWSAWSARTETDYTHLLYGHYVFQVRARSNLGVLSPIQRYTFEVNPAWYQSIWAYIIYSLLLVAGLGALLRWQQYRFEQHTQKMEKEQERLSYLHSLELDRKEKGLIALQNEKLESELQFKNKELATVTMHLVERGGLLSNIKEELIAVIKKGNISHLSFEFKNVFRMLTPTEKTEEEWGRFSLYFDEVHNNFLSTLKGKYPTLSPTDLKLCAYLRLNLSSKEIAQLLNISLKGVEISRYRVRKKFQLTPEINLYDFLIEVTGGARPDEGAPA